MCARPYFILKAGVGDLYGLANADQFSRSPCRKILYLEDRLVEKCVSLTKFESKCGIIKKKYFGLRKRFFEYYYGKN